MPEMYLVDKTTRVPVKFGDELTNFRGEKAVCSGWQKPHRVGAAGRVIVKNDLSSGQEFYPNVYGLVWEEK